MSGAKRYGWYSFHMDLMHGTIQYQRMDTGEYVHVTCVSNSDSDNGGADWKDMVMVGEIQGNPIAGKRGLEKRKDAYQLKTPSATE